MDSKPTKQRVLNNKVAVKVDEPATEQVLQRDFYTQEVVELARALVGKVIVRDLPEGRIKAIIVETEAYKAPEDKACHAYNNKKTDRTKWFWQEGGHFYVYNIYGPQNMCINITAADAASPEAVLIRAVQPIEGEEIVRSLRKTACKRVQDFTNGPGKTGMALGIDKSHNGFDLTKGEGCYLIDSTANYKIGVSTRINIDYAEEWKEKPWRFFVEGNAYVSKK